ncbi:MAG: metal-dependent transcriptional regulator [Victivallales bacterium]|nr:metal-dependent transcriptional regulator [Victivallales bacterium]
MNSKLSESLEDYLEAIAELIEVEGHAHAKQIAARMHVKMPSVTGALRQLAKMDYIIYDTHYPVVLTENGNRIARAIIHRHQVLKAFFANVLGLPLDQASQTACHLEHNVDENTIRRFVLFSEAIEKRTDVGSLRSYLTEAFANLENPATAEWVTLNQLGPGTRLVVQRLGRQIANAQGLPEAGTRLQVQGISLDGLSIRLSCGRKTMSVPLELAENIWVSVLPDKQPGA